MHASLGSCGTDYKWSANDTWDSDLNYKTDSFPGDDEEEWIKPCHFFLLVFANHESACT